MKQIIIVPFTFEVPDQQWSANTEQLVLVPIQDYVNRTRRAIDRFRQKHRGIENKIVAK